MGSDSDLATMKAAADIVESFGVPTEVSIVSAHRTPDRMLQYARTAHERGLQVIIAGAGTWIVPHIRVCHMRWRFYALNC